MGIAHAITSDAGECAPPAIPRLAFALRSFQVPWIRIGTTVDIRTTGTTKFPVGQTHVCLSLSGSLTSDYVRTNQRTGYATGIRHCNGSGPGQAGAAAQTRSPCQDTC